MSSAPDAGSALTSRPRTYLIAKDDSLLAPASLGPLDFDFLVEQLDADPAVRVDKKLKPRSFSAQVLGTSMTDQVVVATMSDSVAAELAKHPQVVLEEDYPVLPQPSILTDIAANDPGLLIPFGPGLSWTVRLTGTDGRPVSGATVYLYGSGVPAQGKTDATGSVTLELRNESDATLRALYVNPLSDYWSLWVNRPSLVSGTVNTVLLQPLSSSFPGFPATQLLGWGQHAMHLDQVPRTMTGRGVKVAVVDSGAAALTHTDLLTVRAGVDLTTTPENSERWKDDTIAHGSHCTGIIAGSNDGRGIRGFAPEVQMFEARIFPGGSVSSLLDAVDYCIENEIDVVNMSLGTGGSSQPLLQKIAQAKELGVACIVAAGNSGGAVQFPGTSPDVLTVAAIGQDAQFPDDSYHAQQRWSAGTADQGFFSAQFSCHGPEVDVCGPGVAVVSSVPPNGFAAWDGTSMATPHIAGLAALVLAHHPDFQTDALRLRNAARVDHLFGILRSSATALRFGDPTRSGAGLPDAVRALGLGPNRVQGPVGVSQTDAVAIALAQLREEVISIGLAAQPLSATPPVADPKPVGIKRDLSELRAQMLSTGLTPASL